MRTLVPLLILGLATTAYAQDIKPPSSTTEELTPMQEEELVPRKKKQEYDEKDIPEVHTEKESSKSGYKPIKCERPTLNFSPITGGTGKIQLEANAIYRTTDIDDLDISTLIIDVYGSYGLADSMDLLVDIELLKNVSGDDNRSSDFDNTGIGDIRIGIKWGLLAAGAILPDVSTVLMYKIPTGKESDRLGTGEGDLTLLSAIGLGGDILIKDLDLNANVGISYAGDTNDSDRSIVQYILGIEGRLELGDLQLFGEIIYLSDLDDNRGTQTTALIGGSFDFIEGMQIDIAVRFGISDDADDYEIIIGLGSLLGQLFGM